MRPLRIAVEDGWYHVCGRGIDRRVIYTDDRERRHFLELLEKAVERYRLVIHAYALMVNHYHLVVQTPEANLSSAMQWLTTSYSMWFNKRNGRVGPLFQGRYKSIPIENSAWGYDCSLYVHVNPVVRAEFGLDPWSKKVEGYGRRNPSEGEARRRLRELRSYRWSSYRAYAGYAGTPAWLTTEEILRRASRKVDERRAKYRGEAEYKLTRGVPEGFLDRLKGGVALGSEQYLGKIKGLAKNCSRDIEGRKKLRERVGYKDIVKIVEDICNERYNDFMVGRGHIGKPLMLWAARQYSGLTLREIGGLAGGMYYKAVGMVIGRFEKRAEKEGRIRELMKKVTERVWNVET